MTPEVLAVLAVFCTEPFTCEAGALQNDRVHTFFRLHNGKRFEFCWVERNDASTLRCRNIEKRGSRRRKL